MRNHYIKSKAFTIIELMVVVVIISMLATIVFVTLENGKIKSRDAKRKADLATIASSLEQYRVDYKKYPPSNDINNYCDIDACDQLNINTTGGFLNYQNSLPIDPLAPSSKYRYRSDGSQYKLLAKSEGISSTDGSICSDSILKQKAGDYCNPVDKTQFQVSSNNFVLNNW